MTLDLTAIDGIEGVSDSIKKQLKGQLIAQYQSDIQSYTKEFARYKQDCRKRALDLAHVELLRVNRAAELPSTEGEITEVDVLTVADKYYQWLITIPENK